MLRSFLLITFRILWRNKVTSFVNILSLSIGITAFLFIILYVYHETSHDKFNKNYNHIYRLEGDDYAKLPPVFGMYLKDAVPEIEKIALLAGGMNSVFNYFPEAHPDNQKQIQGISFWADSTTFDLFTFSFIKGDARSALTRPMTTVLTESTAKKLFGDDDAMGKVINANNHKYMVTGIIEDIKNSHLKVDVLLSIASFSQIFPGRDLNDTVTSSWLWCATYLLMNGDIDKNLVEEKISKALGKINDEVLLNTKFERFDLTSLKDIYFDTNAVKLPYGLHGNIKMIKVLVAIAIFLLVLACINYINLSTARSTIRTKEIAVKRITGSSASQLRLQLIVESVIVSLISLVAAITFIQFFLAEFSKVTLVDIQITNLNHPFVWVGVVGSALFLGVLSGIYPAFYLTAIKPVNLIKAGGVKISDRSLFRSWLVTFQFALSIVMIVSIIVNLRQLMYMRNADLGFNPKQIITFHTPDGPGEFALRTAFKSKLLRHAGIENISYTYGSPGMELPEAPTLEINGTHGTARVLYVDEEYLDMMRIPVVEGRDFSLNNLGDQFNDSTLTASVIINESFVREFGINDPVGKRFIYPTGKIFSAEIIGVIKDFHFRSFHDNIQPLIFIWIPNPGITASIKVAPSKIPASIRTVESEFKSVWGSKPFAYQFLDDIFNQQYSNDEQLASVIGYFTMVALIIACLGLFALSSFMVTSRRKEIGIRKSMGASVATIYSMLSWDFLKWILIAVLIASPVAWFIMRLWL